MKVIYTLATAGFSDLVDLKVGTSLAKAGNRVCYTVYIFNMQRCAQCRTGTQHSGEVQTECPSAHRRLVEEGSQSVLQVCVRGG